MSLETHTTDIVEDLPSIRHEAVPQLILNMIIDKVLSGRLRPGDKLPTENQFVDKLHVGRNSVREAIKVLSVLGVVEIRRGSGTYISTVMSSSVLEPLILSLAIDQTTPSTLVELRLMIDTGIVDLVIDKADADGVENLERANDALLAAAEAEVPDLEALRNLDLNFHFVLFELTDNPFVKKLARAIYRLFYRSIEQTVGMDPSQAYENHKLIIEAIKNKQREKVRESVRRSFVFWRNHLMDQSGRDQT
jgi:GntR family transcriptional repressor for pyruvate dehydrogenase complex